MQLRKKHKLMDGKNVNFIHFANGNGRMRMKRLRRHGANLDAVVLML